MAQNLDFAFLSPNRCSKQGKDESRSSISVCDLNCMTFRALSQLFCRRTVAEIDAPQVSAGWDVG